MYVTQLSEEHQALIRECLESKGIRGEDLELAMDSKLIDLEEVLSAEMIKEMSSKWKNG